MSDPKSNSLLQEILQEWNKAEYSIKLAEQLDNRVVFAAINELRYAGRRLVEALGHDTDENKSVELLSDTRFFCHRARHDAIDAATNKMIGDLDQAEKILGPENILAFYPKFTELLYKLGTIRERIATSREQREKRDAIYDFIEHAAVEEDGVYGLFREFRYSESRIKAIAAKRERRQTLNNVFGVVGIISLLVGVVALLLTIYGVPSLDWLPPPVRPGSD